MRSEKHRQKRKKQLNKLSKITVLTFTICFLLLIATFIGGKFSTKQIRDTSIPVVSAQALQVSVGPKEKFGNSHLQQTYAEKVREAQLERQRQTQQAKDEQDKAIYLTFDDGPSEAAGKLLDTLDQFDAKATFFMLGPNIHEYPEVVKRMTAEGHAVGSHGITHNAQLFYQSAKAPLDEMIEGQKIIADVTGVQSKLVRTPYGSIPYLTEGMRSKLVQQHFKVWDWNIDSRDWEFMSSKYVGYTISQIVHIEQSGETPIVLMHDKPETIKYLPSLLKYLKANGYQTKVLTNKMAPYTFKCEGRCHKIAGS